MEELDKKKYFIVNYAGTITIIVLVVILLIMYFIRLDNYPLLFIIIKLIAGIEI